MADLVTLSEVKRLLRVDGTDEDALLSELITSASERVAGYLEWGEDSSGGTSSFPDDIPERVRTATAMLVGYLHRSPDADTDGAFGHGRLPFPVTSMLYDLRDPPLA